MHKTHPTQDSVDGDANSTKWLRVLGKKVAQISLYFLLYISIFKAY